jgi:hypothetical protein
VAMVNPRKRQRRVVGGAASLVLIALISCSGDGGGPGPSSGLSRQATIASLTTQQAGTLCDWTNAKQGGYGRDATCSDGSDQGTDPDMESCVESVPLVGALCPTLTVGDIEDCANATGTDLCAFATAAGCAVFRQCMESVASP